MLEQLKTLFAILGGVATVVALYKVYNGRLKLRATGELSKHALPTNNLEVILNFRKELDTLVTEELQDHEVKTKRLGSIEKKWPSGLFTTHSWGLFSSHYCWRLQITNTGKAEARDLLLHVPFKGIYSIGGDAPKEFDKEISLGNLRARGSIHARVWADTFSGQSDGREMHITHSAGSIPISIGHIVYGKLGASAALMQREGFLLFLAFLVLLSLMFLTFLTIDAKRESPDANKALSVPPAIPAPASSTSKAE